MNPNSFILKIYIFFCIFINHQGLNAQVGKGTSAPIASAILDLSSTTQGFLPPRMTVDEIKSVANPTAGLIVYCTNCEFPEPYFYDGVEYVGFSKLSHTLPQPDIVSLDCSGISHIGSITTFRDAAVGNNIFTIPYTGGNGDYSPSMVFPARGSAAGSLIATLFSQTLTTSSTNGIFTFAVSGVGTTTSITATNVFFDIDLLGETCTVSRTITPLPYVDSLSCSSITTNFSRAFYAATPSSSPSFVTIPYVGGNSVTHNGSEMFSSTGVTGLTATLRSGTATPNGNAIFDITGTPNAAGTAVFNLAFGEKTCTFSVAVGTTPLILIGNLAVGSTFIHGMDGLSTSPNYNNALSGADVLTILADSRYNTPAKLFTALGLDINVVGSLSNNRITVLGRYDATNHNSFFAAGDSPGGNNGPWGSNINFGIVGNASTSSTMQYRISLYYQ